MSPQPNQPATQINPQRTSQLSFWLPACFLLALVQIPWAGYQLGVGNQGIQVSFLETLHNPKLFIRDLMVRETLNNYPSFFFHLCAPLLTLFTLPTLYLMLHLAATAGVFACVCGLSRSIVRDSWTAFTVLVILLAGHHQSLGGDALYSPGLTHTWAVFPLILLALSFFYRERYTWAFALAGVSFNLHALEAAHLVFLMGFATLCQVRKLGWNWLIFWVGLFLVVASPTLVIMVQQHLQIMQHHLAFDSQWLRWMHARSALADHSFPSSWWNAANPDIPRFFCIVALGAVSMGYPLRPAQRRKTLLLAVGGGVLFLVGTFFTEWRPIPVIIRAQLFRSSRLLLVVALIVIAHACVAAWRLPWRRPKQIPPWQTWLEFANATVTVVTLAIPSMLVLLPVALALSLIVALVNSRLTWHQALLGGGTVVLCVIAWQSIYFVIPGLPPTIAWTSLLDWHGPSVVGWLLIGAVVMLWILSTRPMANYRRYALSAGSIIIAGAAGAVMFPQILCNSPADQAAWIDAQEWARSHTPFNALFLTPAQQAGFRIHSERAIVGEWRDGTQLYFDAGFAKPWSERMNALQPGMVTDTDGTLLSSGRPLGSLDDEQVAALAKQFGADYVVLPHGDQRSLRKAYDNGVWAIYMPETEEAVTSTHSNELVAEDQFIREKAIPNIEAYRKSDAWVQVVDRAGRPIDDVKYAIRQVGSSFGFGCSLPFFKSPDVDTHADYKPPAVTPPELNSFLNVFNYSVIAFSGQWRFTEPRQGQVNYADLDQYVSWCQEHTIRCEFHFITGYQPTWFKILSPADQTRVLLARTRDLENRYGNRISDWQLLSDRIGLDQVAQVFAEMRKAEPHVRLGLADEVRFSPAQGAAKTQSATMTCIEDLRQLRQKNVQVDFLSIEARHPTGLWASGSDIYAALDAISRENVPVHIAEFGVPIGARIEGDVIEGRWTPELQASYYEHFLTICFSHPNVEAINIMGIGPTTWMEGQGLLDEHYEPTPAFNALQRLIGRQWRTQLSGVLGFDGAASFRGFHGAYQMTLTFPNGRTAETAFTLAPHGTGKFRYVWDQAAGKLTTDLSPR
jgi:GH35 family endo-1,4-beta-xylanase